jgi:orotate phosphoribosyltransferase
MAAHEDLGARLLEMSRIEGDFVLSSGRRSRVYFDKFLFLTDPAVLADLAAVVRDTLPDDLTHLAAPEGAATLLLAAVALETGLPMAVVRREAKAYGTMAQVEGHVQAGSRVALLEDVSTTGHQVAAAARALEEAGAEIACIVLAIDRGGARHLREAGYRVETVASLSPDPED